MSENLLNRPMVGITGAAATVQAPGDSDLVRASWDVRASGTIQWSGGLRFVLNDSARHGVVAS
jgi:hypothetical protein